MEVDTVSSNGDSFINNIVTYLDIERIDLSLQERLWEELSLSQGGMIFGIEKTMQSFCQVCLKEEAVMTTDYSMDPDHQEWKSICFKCFEKRFQS